MSVYSFEKPQSLIVRLVELRVGRDLILGKEMWRERESTHYSIAYQLHSNCEGKSYFHLIVTFPPLLSCTLRFQVDSNGNHKSFKWDDLR